MDTDTSNIINDLLRQNTKLKLKNENYINRIDNLNYLNSKKAPKGAFLFVARDGIEPPTQGFSVLCSTD